MPPSRPVRSLSLDLFAVLLTALVLHAAPAAAEAAAIIATSVALSDMSPPYSFPAALCREVLKKLPPEATDPVLKDLPGRIRNQHSADHLRQLAQELSLPADTPNTLDTTAAPPP